MFRPEKISKQNSSPVHSLQQLDHIDQRLIELLLDNPCSKNTELANMLGVSSATVGNRLKNLFEQNLFKIIARVDIRLLGFSHLCQVSVKNPTTALLRVLEKQPYVLVMAQQSDSNDYYLSVAYNCLNELSKTLTQLFSVHARDAMCTYTDFIEVYKSDFYAATFSNKHNNHAELYYQAIQQHCDSTDAEILCRLMVDSRLSNRKIARAINVSEHSVRKRIASLTEKKLLRTGTVLNEAALGSREWIIHGEVTASIACFSKTIDWLRANNHVHFLAHTTGDSNLTYNAIFDSKQQMQDFSKELSKIAPCHCVIPLKPAIVFKHEFMRLI